MLLLFVVMVFLSSYALGEGVTILRLDGVGVVKADVAQKKLIFSSYGGAMEFSVCWNELHWDGNMELYTGSEKCVQGEAGGWAKNAFRVREREVRMPHYRTFIVTIGRYTKIAVAVCRENDGQLGCVKIKQ